MLSGPRDDRRPKILLVDDHPHVLTAVRNVLEPAFRVVDAVTDGQLAIDAAFRLDPDAIVLDVGMPDTDGFQTSRELKRRGSRASILFLTMHDSEEYVVTAVEAGALGYVLKSRILSDLPSALDHVLAQRLFLPSLTSLVAAARQGRGHTVQFHADDRLWLDDAGNFVGKALRRGDPVAVIATPSTLAGIARRLARLGLDLGVATEQGRCQVFDVVETLSHIMRDGCPDREAIATVTESLERARRAIAPGHSRMTIFGELVIPLCRSGQVEAAISVEQIWNEFTSTLPFLTVCSYPISCFADNATRARFQRVCAEHHAVIHA